MPGVRRQALAVAACALMGCGGAPPAPSKTALLTPAVPVPGVRVAKDRPPVVVVARDGDPATAVGLAVTTEGLDGDAPEIAAALAGVVAQRLTDAKLQARLTPSWDGFRASVVVGAPDAVSAIAETVRAALTTPPTEADLATARRKIAALDARPLRDAGLARWAECAASPYGAPARAGSDGSHVTLPMLAGWMRAALGLGRVALSVTAAPNVTEEFARGVARAPAWRAAETALVRNAASRGAETQATVFEAPSESPADKATVYVTLDVGTSSAAVSVAEALGDARGPLASRLAALEVPFVVREVIGTAHASGGCVAVTLEPDLRGNRNEPLAAARVAEAAALVQVEADVRLGEGGKTVDGRTLAFRAGDARDAAELAAWWMLVDTALAKPSRGSVAVLVPARRGTSARTEPTQDAMTRDGLAAALGRATEAWRANVVEARSRIERGQGEAWLLLASPCGTEAETDVDAGFTALVAVAAADAAEHAPYVAVEPWVTAGGVGVLVHGPALTGETPLAHARRLADVAARSFASEPFGPTVLARARAEVLHRESRGGPALATLASALAPSHPSWVVAWGNDEPVARSADGAILARAQALRAGPLRLAVLANADEAQADAAARAADRWVDRRVDGRSCRPAGSSAPPRPGTYAVTAVAGAVPEAYLAFPLPAGDEAAYAAAQLVAAALDGGGILETTVGKVARTSSARILGWPRAPALVVHVTAPESSLDSAVMQIRATVDRLRQEGMPKADYDRAMASLSHDALTAALDPRARVVATWRRVPLTVSAPPAPEVKAFAAKHLAEDQMIVVAARPRSGAPKP